MRKVSRYNEAWTVSQTLAEYMRLEHRLASLGVGGVDVDLDEVRLRLDIMFGRLDILEEGTLREFVGSDPAHGRVISDLRATLEYVERELNKPVLDIRPSLERLSRLDGPMTGLASAASEFGASRIRADQQELEQLHIVYTGLAAGLILCGILLVFLLIHHNRLLGRAHSGMQQLTDDLRETTAELQVQNERLEYVAHHDSLTALPNRILFRQKLDAALNTGNDGRAAPSAVLLLDLDGFKDVNDTLGHDVGDALLQAVAERLRATMGPGDVVCRLGGDEFVVLSAKTDMEKAEALGQLLLALVASPYTVNGRTITINTSIGIALSDEASSSDKLLKQADLALYEAKAAGRGRACVFHTELQTRFQDHKSFEADLREALQNGEFQVHYQPQVNASTRAVESYEALLRWNHPVRGSVPPSQFIPIAEDMGMIHELGEWVLRTACSEAASWEVPLSVAVNLSPVQFRSKCLLQSVIGALNASGLPASRLELEITESVLLDADDRTSETLKGLKDLGIRIAMDDFGTGYSSLGNLRRFPFDKIKIDRSFIRDITTQPDALSIVGLIIGVAKSLGMATTAEGIEIEDQFRILMALGCGQMQGYLIGRPAEPSQLAATRAEPKLAKPKRSRSGTSA